MLTTNGVLSIDCTLSVSSHSPGLGNLHAARLGATWVLAFMSVVRT